MRFDIKVEGGPAGEGGERYYNYVRLVRGGDVTETPDGDPNANDTAPELEFIGAGGPEGTSANTNQPPTDGQQPPQGGPQGSQMPDLAIAATQLGVTEEALQAALGDPSQGQPDFGAVAEQLGVTVEALTEALGTP